jgi:hypothetical protein
MAETADAMSHVTVRKQKVSGFSETQQYVVIRISTLTTGRAVA